MYVYVLQVDRHLDGMTLAQLGLVIWGTTRVELQPPDAWLQAFRAKVAADDVGATADTGDDRAGTAGDVALLRPGEDASSSRVSVRAGFSVSSSSKNSSNMTSGATRPDAGGAGGPRKQARTHMHPSVMGAEDLFPHPTPPHPPPPFSPAPTHLQAG